MLDHFIHCVIRVFGRPRETRATLLSVGRLYAIDRMKISILYTPSLDDGLRLSPSEMERLTGRNYLSQITESVPLDDLLNEAGLNATIITETEIVEGNHCFGVAVKNYKADDQNAQFLWIENDILFNPDCIEHMEWIRDDARQAYRIGVTTAYPLYAKHYHTTDLNPDRPYYTCTKVPGSIWLIDAQAMRTIDGSDPLWQTEGRWDMIISDRLTKAGYVHICPRQAYAQNVGVRGYTTTLDKWTNNTGSRVFRPAPEIRDLAQEFLQCG